ncbi:GNAT family N-acetyltransferase [Pedobacter gandavensis]|uniref:GNAT family N-acetyltransferase n=1 Tax=Pedobacter gandavensis TaxID=2679963 RepID=UPI00292EE999|nr:GNAT family N-acetyltransferase [Pedobacter gandavensis]
MNHTVYLRPLKVEDAETSYQWRNNPEIWVYTEFKPGNPGITMEKETAWLQAKLEKETDKRFAICLEDTAQYIGNVQLIDLKDGQAEFHMFIGEPQFWGKGIGKAATKLILGQAFSELNLDSIFLFAHEDNIAGHSIYKKMGFVPLSKHGNQVKMLLTKENFTPGN